MNPIPKLNQKIKETLMSEGHSEEDAERITITILLKITVALLEVREMKEENERAKN